MTPVPVHTVDGDSLSEIAILNFEKSWKIKIRVLPYGRQPLHIRTVYLDRRKMESVYTPLYIFMLIFKAKFPNIFWSVAQLLEKDIWPLSHSCSLTVCLNVFNHKNS